MLLSIRDLTKSFPGMRALDAVDFDLAAGEVHALLGENGAGKSTLIKCLTGAYRRDAGEISLNGAAIDPHSTVEAQDLGIGTVYQEVNLLPNLTVAQNLMFGREPRRFGLIDARALRLGAREMLRHYGLDIDVDRDLGSYSVAIQQIIAIARAVALSGKVLILDEPTASLDAREVDQGEAEDPELSSPYVGDGLLDPLAWLHDAIALALPERLLCREDCAGLCEVCGISLNDVEPGTHVHESAPDPRFAKLRDLLE